MTVAELIRKLQHMPQDAEVMYEGAAIREVSNYTGSFTPPEDRCVELAAWDCCEECG